MASLREIKQRINNVSSTEQIVKAMNMIASTKLHKARAQLEGVRPIYHKLTQTVQELGTCLKAQEHPFFKLREAKNSLYIVLTSDRGFSGGYNANIMAKALEHMNQGKNEKLLVIGSKGHEYFKKRGKNIVRTITDVADAQVYYGSESVAKWAADLYLSGEVDEVFIVYTQFESLLNYIPHVDRLLPAFSDSTAVDDDDRKFEPDIFTYIDHIIPFYLHMSLFRAFSESHTSEQAARMVTMDAARKNAEDMIEELTRVFNRKRQAAITQELSEIVGSAEVLNNFD
ncbi:MAG TPA: ATP synthase F1 subunit gamma [Firmicutes bacterium]|nr:ATP synthase F1 subunit gamma [Bacillota bacterium]